MKTKIFKFIVLHVREFVDFPCKFMPEMGYILRFSYPLRRLLARYFRCPSGLLKKDFGFPSKLLKKGFWVSQ